MARYAQGQFPNNDRVIEIMDGFIEEYYQRLKGLIPDNAGPLDDNELDVIQSASQADAGGTVYDSETAPFYICRYGKAYIYEYALIYDMLLRILNNDRNYNVKMLSLGCGSMIDAFSMVFAASKLAFNSDFYMKVPRISYTGVDLAPWDEFCLMVTPDTINGRVNPNSNPNTDPIALRFENVEFIRESMFDYLRRQYPVGSNFDSNVIVFPKVINTIADHTNELLDCFRNRNFPLDEYFIVVSHAESSAPQTMQVVDDLIDIIKETGEFDVSSDLRVMLGDDKWKSVHNTYVGGSKNQENIAPDRMLIVGNEERRVNSEQNCYIFSGDIPISRFRSEFTLGASHDYLERLDARVDTNCRTKAITSVKYFTFEIVRLKRR